MSGLEVCPNLARLHLGQGLDEGVSLEPLRRLPKLRHLAVCHTQKLRDVEVLETLELESISATNVPARDATWARVLDVLRRRGTTFR